MKLGRSQDGPGNTAVLDEVFAGELGFAIGIRVPINSHNRNIDHMRDIRLAGSVQQAARALEIELPGSIACGMDHHIHALDGTRETRAGHQISLLPLSAGPILSRAGPATHPTHGIACRTQVLHHPAAQSSRTACHQNMLHRLSFRASLCFACCTYVWRKRKPPSATLEMKLRASPRRA